MAEESSKPTPVRSEDALGLMWDRSIADTLAKSGAGTALGAVASLLFFKRRPWPVIFGLGTGFGMGIANFQNDYRSYVAKAPRKITETQPSRESQAEGE